MEANWEICKQHALWGTPSGTGARVRRGDELFLWKSREGWVAYCAADGPIAEEQLSGWMHAHLRVAVLPVPSELVSSLEDELVSRTLPPLNLAGVPKDDARSTLSRLRGLISRPTPSPADRPAPRPPDEAAESAAAAFERRMRSDHEAIVAAGYKPTVFQRMMAEQGAVETAKRLLAASQMSDGFSYLREHGLLRNSVENAVLDPAFSELFTAREREVARVLLVDAGYR